MDSIEGLGDLVAQHKWVAVSSVAIGLTTRLLKSDTKLPIDVPPRARIWVVLALGIVSGVLESLAAHKPWQPALVDGLVSAFLAVIGHETIIASIRAGKEIPVPGLMQPGMPPAPTAPVTVPLDNKPTPVVNIIPPVEALPVSGDRFTFPKDPGA